MPSQPDDLLSHHPALLQDGGALAKMLPVFSLFAGGPLGSGQQWFSWVHRDDLVALVIEVGRLTRRDVDQPYMLRCWQGGQCERGTHSSALEDL